MSPDLRGCRCVTAPLKAAALAPGRSPLESTCSVPGTQRPPPPSPASVESPMGRDPCHGDHQGMARTSSGCRWTHVSRSQGCGDPAALDLDSGSYTATRVKRTHGDMQADAGLVRPEWSRGPCTSYADVTVRDPGRDMALLLCLVFECKQKNTRLANHHSLCSVSCGFL